MDNYTMDDVKTLIDSNMLSPEVLHLIFESTTRKLNTYKDDNSLDILNYLEKSSDIPLEIRNEIRNFLSTYNDSDLIENTLTEKSESKISAFYIVIGILTLLLGIVIFFVYK